VQVLYLTNEEMLETMVQREKDDFKYAAKQAKKQKAIRDSFQVRGGGEVQPAAVAQVFDEVASRSTKP
jgi:hypothetical protein